MNLKTWLPLGLAVVLGVAALKLGRDWMEKNKGGETNTGNLVEVVVAKQGIGAGETLTAENCQIGHVAPESQPENSFDSLDKVQGRVASNQMSKGQAVVETLLAPTGAGSGIQAVVPAGMRAIAIEINEFSGVGGMLVPGAHVDLIATMQGENGGEMIARTVVQNIEIGAVGQRMVKQPDKKTDEPQVFRSVTLFVTPAEAEAVELAATNGRPRLVLRNSNDKAFTTTPGVTASNLRGHSARKIDPAYSSVKVIRGTTESEVRIDTGWFDSNAKGANPAVDNKTVSGTETAPITH